MAIERVKDFHRQLMAFGPRAPGSDTERRVAEFLLAELRARGVDGRIETFTEASHNATVSSLSVAGCDEGFAALPLQFAVAGAVAGPLVYLGTTAKPLKGGGAVAGKIGLLFPDGGLDVRLRQCLEWERAGLRGIIAISAGMDIVSTKMMRFPELGIPAVAVTWRTGNQLVFQEGREVSLRVDWTTTPRAESQNVVVEKPGSNDYWLAVSAHYDSAAYAPGAMDNGGGTALLMELITRLKDRSFPASVRFFFSGSEENGGHDTCGAGSRAFYASRLGELETCIAHLETDDLGNALGIPEFFYRGDERFLSVALDPAMRDRYVLTEKAAFSCDSGIPAQNGIPFVFLSDAISYPRPWYHTPEDKPVCMDFDKLLAHLPHVEGMLTRLAGAAPFQSWIRQGEVTVRPARVSDFPAIGETIAAAFGPYSMDRIREEFFGVQLGGKPWRHHKIATTLGYIRRNLPLTIVAEVDGRVVGFASEMYQPEQGIAAIGNNAVLPEFQGRGIGSLMQREIERRMRAAGYRRFTVSTLENDLPAQRVYEKLGYKRVSATWHYLKDEGAGDVKEGDK